ncbi:MAG: hypothetical protein RIR12_1710 [Bacteroidota bacterium]|jgi:hypothetical protein
MRYTALFFLLFFAKPIIGQVKGFPNAWKGCWKGELAWYKTGHAKPQKVAMQLCITPADSAKWNWQLIYGNEKKDNRPYELYKKDTAGIHWVIDEKNGIVLDQFWVGNKLSGAFTVMNSTIFNTYWLEKGQLHVSFYSISTSAIHATGLGTEESPTVNSYKVNSYQKAILTKIK